MTRHATLRPAKEGGSTFAARGPRNLFYAPRFTYVDSSNRNWLSCGYLSPGGVFCSTIFNRTKRGELRKIVTASLETTRLTFTKLEFRKVDLLNPTWRVFQSLARRNPVRKPWKRSRSSEQTASGRVNISGPPGVRDAKNSLTRICRFVENRRERRNRRDLWRRTGACEESAC